MARRFARWSRNALLVTIAGGLIAAASGIAGVELQIHSTSPDCIGRDQAIAQLLDQHPEERSYVEGQTDGLEGACGSVKSFVEHLRLQKPAP
jgi:hypothetical protein